MIGELIKILQSNDFEGVSDAVDIAKGKYRYPRTYKEVWKWFKRDLKSYGKNRNNRN